PNCIAVTKDAGRTWKLVPAPVAWSEGNGAHIFGDTTLLFATDQNGLFFTNDEGQSWKKVGPGAAGVGAGTAAYRAADGTFYIASSYGVLASKDAETWDNIHPGGFHQFAGSGSSMYVSSPWSFDYFTAKESAPTSWSPLVVSNAPTTSVGGVYMD